MSAIIGSHDDDQLLADLLGEPPVRSEPVRWGFDADTRLVTLVSGRRVVVQMRAIDVTGGLAGRIRTATGILRAVGIGAPTLLDAVVTGRRELLVFELVAGIPGPELLDDPVRGPALARSMGALVRSLAMIGTTGIGSDGPWSTPVALRLGCHQWLARLGDEVPPPAAGRALGEVAGRIWMPVVSHGDFVPANVLVASDGSLVLLDLGALAVRHPCLDAAWWMLIVRHHHARLARQLNSRIFTAAALDRDAAPSRLLSSVALLRALQLAAAAEPGDARRHLLRLAATAIAWSADGPDGA